MKRFATAVVALAVVASLARADVKPHALISENMVLQRGVKVPIWGTASDGEKVTVSFNGQEVSTVASDGKWLVNLEPLKAGGPHPLTITGKNTIKLENVLVGEVWIASGQSNMEWSIDASESPMQIKAAANNPKIRFFLVPHTVIGKPQTETAGQWVPVGPKTLGSYSAVAYHFARNLQKALDVPVGVIQSAWGGTIAEAWTARGALEADPMLKSLVPSEVKPGNPNQGTALYNGMIAPLQPFAFKGVIWYQGESNAGRAAQYRTLFPTLIKSWRDAWKNSEMPFLFVQLAPFMAINPGPEDSAWAELREAQLLTSLTVPKTGMAVITDLGDPRDIHPRPKGPVGSRLALAARAIAYGEKIAHSGPVLDAMKVEGNKAVLTFTNLGKGLEDKYGDALTGFTIAGPDKKFYNALAQIQGDKVVVWSGKVEKPVAVRYAWSNCPIVNFYNKDGLPASPFRTDAPVTSAAR